MKLIIIIPAFNEEKNIGQVIKNIPRQIDGMDEIKIMIMNDGSSDNTKGVALEAGADLVIDNKENLGLAKTFKRGLETALENGADIIVNIDADNQYDPAEIPKIIKPILEKKAEIVMGNRQIERLKFMKAGNKYGNLLGSWILRKIIGSNIQDSSSGFRAYSREAALKLNIYYNHTYTHETLIQAAFNKIPTKEVPIEFRERAGGKSKLIKNIFTHIKISTIIIIRTILLYKPLKTLFYLGLIVITPGILLFLRFLYYYLGGHGSGKIQSLIFASVFIIVGFLIILLGLIGDLISNNRKINEEMLYYIKKIKIYKKD